MRNNKISKYVVEYIFMTRCRREFKNKVFMRAEEIVAWLSNTTVFHYTLQHWFTIMQYTACTVQGRTDTVVHNTFELKHRHTLYITWSSLKHCTWLFVKKTWCKQTQTLTVSFVALVYRGIKTSRGEKDAQDLLWSWMRCLAFVLIYQFYNWKLCGFVCLLRK